MNTWVLVANGAGARIFHLAGRELVLLRAVENPAGRRRDQDLPSDGAERTFDEHAKGHTGESSPQEHAAGVFAKHLANELQQGRIRQSVDRIVLVAEPHFLGLVRAMLDPPTARLVVGTVVKDLAKTGTAELTGYLDELPTLRAAL